MELEQSSITHPWAQEPGEVAEALEVDAGEGLSAGEVKKRTEFYGPNQLKETKTRGVLAILVAQLKSLIVALLVVAAALSLWFGERLEALAVIIVIILNTAIGFFTEFKAVQSMEALRKMTRVMVTVRRAGRLRRVSAAELVPGDIVMVEGGDIVAADLRLIEASRLQANESSLTGESAPVGKQVKMVPENTNLPDRINMLFNGSSVTRGTGTAVVVATGMATELGKISQLVEEAEEEATPLERRLEQLGTRLVWLTLAIVAVTTLTGIFVGKEVRLMIETSIALAVAAIPEGLPIVATIALARGMWRMAQRNALINRLSAVETLGSTTLICTDKTGTLTENRMTLVRLEFSSGETFELDDEGIRKTEGGAPINVGDEPRLRRALEIGVLCNNSELKEEGGGDDDGGPRGIGDPMEIAFLLAAEAAQLDVAAIRKRCPRVEEHAFDPEIKMMATCHKAGNGGEDSDGTGQPILFAVKGAAEPVLDHCTRFLKADGTEEPMTDAQRDEWLMRNEELAADGLRLLALACKRGSNAEAEPYEDLVFLGLAALLDPPRQDVRDSIRRAKDAGIRIVMVTGDQAPTAIHVAREVHLLDDGDDEPRVISGREMARGGDGAPEREELAGAHIFARVTPKQKLDLIDLHQERGEVVAMTGDGVNDAPALREADIGIAMGLRGTEVAREAADMVLKDDAFNTIIAAVAQGRAIFENIRKFVLYLLSCNISEVLVVTLATLVNAPLPILPLQILYLNLVTDVFPALALGMGTAERDAMKRPPRDTKETIVTPQHWRMIGAYSAVISITVLGAFAISLRVLEVETGKAVTIAFLVLALAQLFHVFNMSGWNSPLFRNSVTRNPHVWGSVALCLGLTVGPVYLPGLSTVLELERPSAQEWLLVGVASLAPLLVIHAAKGMFQAFSSARRNGKSS